MGKHKNSKKHQQKIKKDLDKIDKLVKELDEKEQKKKLKQVKVEQETPVDEVKQQPISSPVEPTKEKKKKKKHQQAKHQKEQQSNKTEKAEKVEKQASETITNKSEQISKVETPSSTNEVQTKTEQSQEVAPVESTPSSTTSSEANTTSATPVPAGATSEVASSFKQKLGYMTISMRFLSALKREVFKRYKEDSLKKGVKIEEPGEEEGEEPKQEEVQLEAVVEEKGGAVVAEAKAPELEAKVVTVPSLSLPTSEEKSPVPMAPREDEELAQKRRESAKPKNKTREQIFEELDPEKNTIKALVDIGYNIPYLVQYGPASLALTLVVEKKEVSPGKIKKTYSVKLAPVEQTSDEKQQKMQQWTFREDGTIRSVYRKTRVLEIEAGQVVIAKQSLKTKEVPASRQWKVVFSDEKGRPTKSKLICVQKNARLVMAESAKDPSKIAISAMKTVLGGFDLSQKWLFSTKDSSTQ